jgi:hypothetical protein
MTNAQAEWLRAHPEYRPLMKIGGMVTYRRRGVLMADGTFKPVSAQNKPPAHAVEHGPMAGAFGVGVPVVNEPGKGGPADPRNTQNTVRMG